MGWCYKCHGLTSSAGEDTFIWPWWSLMPLKWESFFPSKNMRWDKFFPAENEQYIQASLVLMKVPGYPPLTFLLWKSKVKQQAWQVLLRSGYRLWPKCLGSVWMLLLRAQLHCEGANCVEDVKCFRVDFSSWQTPPLTAWEHRSL